MLFGRVRCISGGIAVMTALMLIPLVALTGLAVDVARFMAVRLDMQHALDLAVLAASRARQNGKDHSEAQAIADSIFTANKPAGAFIQLDAINLGALRPNSNDPVVNAVFSVDYYYQTLMLNIIGVSGVHTSVSSSTQFSVSGDIEFVFVIDMSADSALHPPQLRPNSPPKLELVLNALENTIDELASRSFPGREISASIIPYSSGVTLPRQGTPPRDEMFFTASGLTNKKRYVYIPVGANTLTQMEIDNVINDHMILEEQTTVNPEIYRFTPDLSSALFNFENPLPEKADGQGCRYRYNPSFINAYFCDTVTSCISLRRNDITDSLPGVGRYFEINIDLCDHEMMPLLSLTNSKSEVDNYILSLYNIYNLLPMDRLQRLSRTASYQAGLVWAQNVLSPLWSPIWQRISTDVKAAETYTDATKVIVFLTGGYLSRPPPILSVYQDGVVPVIESNPPTDSDNTVMQRIGRLCSNIKSNGIEIFTILFDAPPQANFVATVRDCADDVQHVFNIDDGTTINESFYEIISRVLSVRLTN